jgi:hypothetical protein
MSTNFSQLPTENENAEKNSPFGTCLTYTSNLPSSLTNIPIEMFKEILKHFSPHEIAQLQRTCLILNTTISLEKFDVFYMPFLNELKRIDPSISVNPPVPLEEHWIKSRFRRVLNEIAKDQKNEIAYLNVLFKNGSNNSKVQEHVTALKQLRTPKTFQELKQTHMRLEQLNAAIIEQYIDTNSPVLNIPRKGITRFPSMLLEKPELQSYWKTLKTLNCSSNKLSRLCLDGCTALNELFCGSNQLTTLFVGSPILQGLNCNSNQLTTLFVASPVLKYLQCYNNQLTRLFVASQILRGLNCNSNQLTTLSVVSTHLLDLDCKYNQLTAPCIAQLAKKFRNIPDWYSSTLATQSQSPNYLPFIEEGTTSISKKRISRPGKDDNDNELHALGSTYIPLSDNKRRKIDSGDDMDDDSEQPQEKKTPGHSP